MLSGNIATNFDNSTVKFKMFFFCYLYLLCSIVIEAVKIDGNVLIKPKKSRTYKTGVSLNAIEDIRRTSEKWRSLRFEEIYYGYEDRKVPPAFDSRERWPQCKSIQRIRDQGKFEWSWAVVCASAATDRLCISTNGNDTFEYSPVYLLTCCKNCTEGGDGIDLLNSGGSSYGAMYFLGNIGGVSEGCIPETLITQKDRTPPCKDKCTESNENIDDAERKFLEGVKFVVTFEDKDRLKMIKQLQIDIMLNGPVVAISQAPLHFRTFFEKKNSDAIYKETAYEDYTDKLTSHVVKMVGWGQENGIPYWICANSWGTSWGDKGFFKIIRGQNLLEIETIHLVPYHKLPKRPTKTTKTTTTTTISLIMYYSCAKMVTIPKSILLLAVIIIL